MKHQLLLFKFMLLIALWAAIPIGMRANNALFSHNAVVGRNVLCYTQSFDLNSRTVSIIIEQDQNLTGEITINEKAYFNNDNLNISGTFTITSVKRIRGNGITKINLPASVTTIEKQAFRDCKGLCEVNMPNVSSIGDLAFYQTALQRANFPKVTTIGKQVFMNCTALREVYTPNVSNLGDFALYGCSNLQRVNLGKIGSVSKNTFGKCTALQEVTLPKVTRIENETFRENKTLKTVTIGTSGSTAKISIGEQAFYQCTCLEDVCFNGPVDISASAFQECKTLQKVQLNGSAHIGEFAFYECEKLKDVDLHQATNIGKKAFANCENLGRVSFGNSLTEIGLEAFLQSGLTGDLNIPGSVKEIGRNAFYECEKLNGRLTLNEGLEKIGNGAFYGTSLTGNMKLPQTLTHIGCNAFQYSEIGVGEDLVIPANVEYIGSQAFLKKEGQKEWRSITFASGSKLKDIGKRETAYFKELKKEGLVSGEIFGGVSHYIDMTECKQLSKENKYDYFFGRAKNITESTDNDGKPIHDKPPFYGVHPWVLIYLPNHITLNEDKKDDQAYPVNFVIGKKCDDLRVYEGHGFKAIHPFTAKSAIYVEKEIPIPNSADLADKTDEFKLIANKHTNHPKRKFYTGEVYTVCLPYPVILNSQFQKHTTVYRLMEQIKENGRRKFYRFISYNAGDTIPANTPFVLRRRKNETGDNSEVFKIMENVWVPITPENIDESDQKDPSKEITFCGTTLEISNKDLKARYNDTNQKVYLLNNKDHAWYPVKAGNTSAWIPPFRGFVRAPKGTVAAKFAFMVDLDEDNNPTGIDELETRGVENGRHTFYTLDGKAMGNNFDALPKGTIYIVNGKKIYKF